MTQPLQMVRAEIGVREFYRWMGIRQLRDPDHGMHCLLVESLGGDLAPKPFRLILPRGGSKGCLYGYGRADAEELRDAASAYADPLQCRALPASSIDSKPMPSEWPVGKQLGFEARVRPIVRRGHSHDVERLRGGEWDAFQLAAMQCPKGQMPHSREQVYTKWLAERLSNGKGGATLELATLQSFQRTRAIRKQNTRYSEGPDALMRGVLTVTDGQAFAELLARGVGRHRAYGYGMLLLRPAGPSVKPPTV